MKEPDRTFEKKALAVGFIISRLRKTFGAASMAIQTGQISATPLIFSGNLIPTDSENAPPSECQTNNGRSNFSLSINSTIASA